MSKTIRNPFTDGLPTLGSVEIPAEKLAILFGCDKRYQESMLQRFIYLNRKTFEYLGIQASIVQRQSKFHLLLESSRYVGTVPLFSPNKGTSFSNLSVVGRYNEEIGELIDLLSSTIRPEYSDSLHLHTLSELKSPIFLECCKYVDKYLEADKFNWTKFSHLSRTEALPRGDTDWNRYAQKRWLNPGDSFPFYNSYNVLCKNHKEWFQLNYVLQLAISILSHHTTPIRIRSAYDNKITVLNRILQNTPKIKVDELRVNGNDPLVVKELKNLGNVILNDDQKMHMAWRIDYSEFFERYVQYIIRKAAMLKGGRTLDNTHLPLKSQNRPAWGLLYLEPDIIFKKEDLKVVIDAKYKSHIFNWDSSTEELKESFRHDLHQILAYSSFSSEKDKRTMIIYPYNRFISREMKIHDPYGDNSVIIHLTGIPISKASVENTVKEIAALLPQKI